MHYIVSLIIVTFVFYKQYISFRGYKINIKNLQDIFPSIMDGFEINQSYDLVEIKTTHENTSLDSIISSLNRYLDKNRGGVSDYHLMKDVVDRNCELLEEEIQAQIPIPIYWGLAGTMLGILIGAGFLVLGGGLKELLDSQSNLISGAKGIEGLLGGVAIAMATSLIGLVFTIIGTLKFKDVKVELESSKNEFLSWIQAELLPKISSDTSSALVSMTRNLEGFNNSFSRNANNLHKILDELSLSYDRQRELMESINQLNIDEIAFANIDVYDKLKNSTEEIGRFTSYMEMSNQYIAAILGLNQKLDTYENRTQVIETAGRFFDKNEKWLANSMDTANLEMQAALTRFTKSTSEYFTELKNVLHNQILDFNSVFSNQQQQIKNSLTKNSELIVENFKKTQQILENEIDEFQQIFLQKLNEVSIIADEIKNLTHIKEGIASFKEAIQKQNIKIDDLTKEIRNLAQGKIGVPDKTTRATHLPKWMNILLIITSNVLIVSGLFYLIPKLITLFSQLI